MKPKSKTKAPRKSKGPQPGPEYVETRKLKAKYIGKRVPPPYVALPLPTAKSGLAYPESTWDLIISRIAAGETLIGVCREENFPDPRGVQFRVLRDKEFCERYNQAVKMRCEVWADQVKALGDEALIGSKVIETTGGKDGPTSRVETYDAVDRAKLNSENTKWLLARLDPSRYGDKLQTENNSNINMSVRVETVKVLVVDPKPMKVIDVRGTS